MNENAIEGRNAVIEAFRAGKTIDRLYVQEGVIPCFETDGESMDVYIACK